MQKIHKKGKRNHAKEPRKHGSIFTELREDESIYKYVLKNRKKKIVKFCKTINNCNDKQLQPCSKIVEQQQKNINTMQSRRIRIMRNVEIVRK